MVSRRNEKDVTRLELMETRRLLIRRFTPSDGNDLYEYLSDADVVKFEPYDVLTLDQSMNEAQRRADHSAFWAVCLKDNGKMIGNLYFEQQQPEECMTWEIGYVFNKRYQGKGFATESAARLLQYGFEVCRAHRIVAHCNPQNTPSWTLLERLHMRREGHYLQKVFFKRDQMGAPLWHDAYAYGILYDEWRQNAAEHISDVLSLYAYFPSMYMIQSILQRGQGRLVAEENCAILNWGPSVYIGGACTSNARKYVQDMLFASETTRFIYAPEGAWKTYLEEILQNHGVTKQVNSYKASFRQDTQSELNNQHIAQIDADFLQRDPLNLNVILGELYSYSSIEDFLQNGYGLAFIMDGVVCGYCLSEYSVNNECAINIWVDAAYRNKGVAKTMTILFLQHAKERGWHVYWGCLSDNEPSIKTALASGFVFHSSIAYLQWK